MNEAKVRAAAKGRTFEFTDKFVDGLKAGPKRQTIREARGFTLQVMAAGKRGGPTTKRWLYLFTWQGKQAELTLGTYPTMSLADARSAHGKAYEKVVKDEIDPRLPEAPKKPSDELLPFKFFADKYIAWSRENHVPDWTDTIEMSLDNDARPVWDEVPLVQIERREIIEVMEAVARRAPGQAKNFYRSLRGLFSWAKDRHYIATNPAGRLAKIIPKLKPTKRRRMLSPQEIRTVWAALNVGSKRNQRTRDAIKLELVLMQRGIEITSMHRDQIDGNWWTIEDTKNDITHRVYLPDMAMKLIGDAEGWIFPSEKKGRDHISRQTLSQHISERHYFGLKQWSPHDLRRTGRTGLSRLRVHKEHAEAIVNHKKQGMDDIYNLHEYDAEKVEAMLDWEEDLRKILEI